MQISEKDQLFVELTPEEEESVSGGLGPLAVLGLQALLGGAAWAWSKVEGLWFNTDGRAGAELRTGVYGPDGGNKSPRDNNQVWEMQWWGNTINGYGRTTMLALRTYARMRGFRV